MIAMVMPSEPDETMLTLYHFTGAEYLEAIGKYGLTVGDVATDFATMRGTVGVWFSTDADNPDGNGLEKSAIDKKRIRLAVEIRQNHPRLVRWLDWSLRNVTPFTREAMVLPGCKPENWFVFFAHLKPDQIIAAHDMLSGEEIDDWRKGLGAVPLRGVKFSQRESWHRKLMKQVRQAMLARERRGTNSKPFA